MRFDRLDIIRYGALTGRVLTFRADARLHVVYGPNEAGKSSALSAISDLLFGFPRATAHFSFLHDAANLRVGAALTARGGESIAFRRRRGARNTLLCDDDKETALLEDALAPFLGGLNREIFKRAFGLGTRDLREGGQAMLQSGGEIGNLLFSAASGLLGLTRLRQVLDDEAGGIFGPRRKQDHSFYQAAERHDKARRAEKDSELKSSDWKRLVAEAEDLQQQVAALQDERRKTKTALEHLTALKKLEPLIIEIDQERLDQAAFDDLAAFPPEFARALADRLETQDGASRTLKAAEDDVERLSDDLRLVHVHQPVLEGAAQIMSLFAETGGYTKARIDLPAIDRELGTYEATLTQLARRLGLADAAVIESRQPTDADLARMRRLAEDGQVIARARQDIGRQQADEQERLQALETAADTGRLIDPKPYADQLATLSADVADMARIDTLTVQVARAERTLSDAAGRLRPAVADLDALFATHLPDVATLSKYRQSMEASAAASRTANDRLKALRDEAEDVAARLDEDERQGAVVTRADIAAARQRRDLRLGRLSDAVTSADAPARGEELAVIAGLVIQADQLSDTALTNADRLARHAENRLRQTRLDEELRRATATCGETEAEASKLTAQYAKLFAASGLVPLDPEAMIDWRRAVDDLGRDRAALDVQKDQLAEIARRQSRVEPILQSLADAVGFEGGWHLPVGPLSQAIGKHLGVLSDRWSESRSREGEKTAARQRLERLVSQEREVHRRFAEWQAEFATAAPAVGLDADATLDMAHAAIEVWKSVPETLMERDNRKRRVAGMRRDIAQFEEKVAAIVAVADPGLAAVSADLAVEALHDMAIGARNDNQKREALAVALEAATTRLSRARDDHAEVVMQLADLAKALPQGADLRSILARLTERARLAGRLAESRARFATQAEGAGEETLRAALAGFDRVAADLDIERLAEEENGQFQRHGELVARQSQVRREREALETGVSAEYAVFEKQAAEAEARDLARQWVVLKLAAGLLSNAMETYRERHADPVMQRAGAHFSVLTGGRFSRLVQEYGSHDELHLLAERKTGEKVPLDGLSEGTGDQLFLALRLAFLEDYATRNEPAPLIVDDIFQTFDDERTVSGLQALAATSGTFQTILFTHQTSVVDLALRELGPDLDLIRL